MCCNNIYTGTNDRLVCFQEFILEQKSNETKNKKVSIKLIGKLMLMVKWALTIKQKQSWQSHIYLAPELMQARTL